jgi:hypothetical protein
VLQCEQRKREKKKEKKRGAFSLRCEKEKKKRNRLVFFFFALCFATQGLFSRKLFLCATICNLFLLLCAHNTKRLFERSFQRERVYKQLCELFLFSLLQCSSAQARLRAKFKHITQRSVKIDFLFNNRKSLESG